MRAKVTTAQIEAIQRMLTQANSPRSRQLELFAVAPSSMQKKRRNPAGACHCGVCS
jgi:hypothetical protein